MLNQHLSESEIQQCALGQDELDSSVLSHSQQCAYCKGKIEMYAYLFREIKAQPEPIFQFDLSSLVMKKLPENRSRRSLNNFLIFLVVLASFSVLAVPIYFFRKTIGHMFSTIIPISMYLILLSAITILLFQSLELFR